MKHTFLIHFCASIATGETVNGNHIAQADTSLMARDGLRQAKEDWATECQHRGCPVQPSEVVICNIMMVLP